MLSTRNETPSSNHHRSETPTTPPTPNPKPNQPTIDRGAATAISQPTFHPSLHERHKQLTTGPGAGCRLAPAKEQINSEVNHPVRGPPCLPSHQSTRAGTQLHQSSEPSRVAQGPLANTRNSRDEHHGPPTVSARPRRSWFDGKAQDADGRQTLPLGILQAETRTNSSTAATDPPS